MSIESELYSKIKNDSAVAGITTRIYPVQIPAKTSLPAIRYMRLSTERFSTMGEDAGIAGAAYQIDCWAETQVQAIDLRDKVRIALQRWRDSTSSPVIQDTFIEAERDMGWEDDLKAYRTSVDALVWAEE